MNAPGKSYTCVIVDDNELDRLTIASFARKYPFVRIIGQFASAMEALEATRTMAPDILMLDIDMPGLTGLELRKQLSEVPACIFVTAHPEYALESFEASALDFLVKPLRPERFEMSMERLEHFLDIHYRAGLMEHTLTEDTLFIKDGRDHIKLKLQDILYLEALKDYTGVITRQKKYCVLTPLGNLLKEPSFSHFVRIHRSYAIQKQSVTMITAKEVVVNGISLPIGRSYKEDLDRLLMS
jgi:two-component system LytT family response regulator